MSLVCLFFVGNDIYKDALFQLAILYERMAKFQLNPFRIPGITIHRPRIAYGVIQV